jgi:transcriptional regulator with XRE-family HTH domain
MKSYNVGKNMRKLRLNLGHTIQEFSKVIHLSPSHISLIENGKRRLTLDNLIRICNIFHIRPDTLLEDDGE